MNNTIDLVREVVGDLAAGGFEAAVFGGWAEQLFGLAPAWEHTDIDLLVFDADLERLDAFVSTRHEIFGKNSSHKRAFTAHDVMVELFLVNDGVSCFWDTLVYRWPDLPLVAAGELPVAPPDYLTAFRRDYATIRSAYQRETS